MEIKSVDELYVEELRDLYSAEEQILKAMPDMIKAVHADDLKQALVHHMEETKVQLQRLTMIFENLGESPTGNTCEGTEGLIKEAVEMMEEVQPGPVLDAALTGAAQRIEYYEQAAYLTAIRLAEALNFTQDAEALRESLLEEENAGVLVADLSEQLLMMHHNALETARAAQ